MESNKSSLINMDKEFYVSNDKLTDNKEIAFVVLNGTLYENKEE